MTNTETAEGAASGVPAAPEAATSNGPVRIGQARALAYKVPQDGPVRVNYVVLLEAQDSAGTTIQGIGEGQPRGELTGDEANASGDFLENLLHKLHQVELPVEDPAESVKMVKSLMKDFAGLAAEHAADPQNKRPYRGTLLGVETALLDLIGKASGLPLYELLGRVRDEAPLIPRPVRPSQPHTKIRASLGRQAGRFEAVRVAGSRDVEKTADFLDLVGLIARSRQVQQAEKPLWLEMDGAMDREEATALVSEIADSMNKGYLPAEVYLEQPVLMRYADHLPTLQKQADELLIQPGAGERKLTIVGDESIWDIHSFGRLKKLGGIRAVSIRPAQAGGLLPSLELAEAVRAYSSDAKITLIRMPGAGRLTESSLKHLALALPCVDGVSVSTFSHSKLPFALWADESQEEDVFAEDESDDAGDLGYQSEDADSEQENLAEEYTSGAKEADSDGDEESSYDDGEDDAAEESVSTGPREREAGESEADDEVPTLRTITAKSLPGLGLTVSYVPLVSEARRFATVPELPEPMNEGKLPARYENVEDVRPLGPNGTKGYLLEKRALARGLSTTRYSKSAFVAFDGVNPAVNFKWSRSPVSSAVAISICTHKEATRLVLEDAGVPTPQGRTFRNGDFDSARAFVKLIGFPVVVKPSMGIRGIGVIAGIEDEEQLEEAFELMADSKFGGQDFIVEKHINGRDHRILVVGGEVVGAIQRKPASILGDGRSSVAELLIHRNVARRVNPHLWTRPAKFDGTMAHQLAKTGLTLESVLPAGEEVTLSNTANISQGADSIDVFDTLHPTIVEACKKAVAAVPGMQYCGVDFLLEDPSKAVDEQDAAIIELNAHAAIGNCEYPMFGTGRQVAQRLMDLTIEQENLQVTDPQKQLTVHLTVRGKVTRVGFRKWLQRHALKMGATGWVRNLNRRTVEAVVQGPTERIAPLVASCIIGPSKALPTSYNATVIPSAEAELPEGGDFEIRSRPAPEELSEAEQAEIHELAQAEQEQDQ